MKNTDLPHPDGLVMIHLTGSLGYKDLSIVFLLNKGLIKFYTMKDNEHISDIPHGMIVNKGNIISILLSLFVQLIIFDKVSL